MPDENSVAAKLDTIIAELKDQRELLEAILNGSEDGLGAQPASGGGPRPPSPPVPD